jgi:hypothetical protein
MTAALSVTQKETLDKFISGAYKLDVMVHFLTEEQLDLSMGPGEWSIRQIVHHVADDGDAWSMVAKKTLAVPGTPVVFTGFPGNEPWANALAFDKRPIPGALSLIKSHRHVMAELAFCFPEKWEQSISFAIPDSKESVNITLAQILFMLTEHVAEHTATIEAIKLKHCI